jgi:hypothetical protein
VSLRLALDQGFPVPIVNALASQIPGVELQSVRDIDPRMAEADDWQLLLALSQLGWDGLVNIDPAMLSLPRELIVIERAKLKVIAIEASGHQPVTATGIFLAHIDHIRRVVAPDHAQVWRLSVRAQNPDSPGNLLNKVANHQKTAPNLLRQRNSPSDSEWGADPLAHIRKPGP